MASAIADVRIVTRERHDRLGEGLLWSARDNAVYWTDILDQRVNRLRLADGSIDSWELPDFVGWIIERAGGGFVAGLGRAFVGLTLEPLSIEPIAAPEPERDGNRFNDAKADAAGRIWAGSMPIDCGRPSGAFYRLDPEGQAFRVDDHYTIPNGPAIGADENGAFLLHTDTAQAVIYRYPVNDDGSLGRRTTHIVFRPEWGNPDGMTFDADRHLWVACWGGGQVARFTPSGQFERAIPLPASQITNVAFAGPALDRMFVTSAADGVDEPHGGDLFEVEPGITGCVPHQFAG